jgi:hypothetical protein
VALVAFNQRMRSNQRESILVILDLLDVYLPAPDRVAALAICSKLTAVNVGMALSTLGAHFLEHQVCMALSACYLCMHSAQRITGLIVIEFGI